MNIKDKWESNVRDAKMLMSARQLNQIKIAELACDACEIRHGGNKHDYQNIYTLRKFADEIGVVEKTLQNWSLLYRSVYKKLEAEHRAVVTFGNLGSISRKINNNTPREEINRIAFNVINRDSFDEKMMRYCAEMRSIAHNFENLEAASRAKKPVVEEIAYYSKLILSNIENRVGKVNAKNNQLAYQSAKSGSSIHLNGLTNDKSHGMKFSLKDEKVYRFVKKIGGGVGPSKIGKTVGNQNENAASAWALRSLEKLQRAKLVTKNEKGYYLPL